MFSYPFLSMMASADPYGLPLASSFEPGFQLTTQQYFSQKQEVAKVEEGTSPDYVFAKPLQQEPRVEIGVRQNNKKNDGTLDEEYRPNERQKVYKPIVKQKEDRNLIPNTVHHLLAFVQKQFKSSYIVEKIFKKVNKNSKYTVARYYNFHKMLRIKVNNYVNEQAMSIITEVGFLDFTEYDEKEQAFYCCVSRIVIRHFLRVEAALLILTSKKVKRENINDHLRVQRYLYEDMMAVYSL